MSKNEAKSSLERLKSVLEAYGANPDRWPDDERDELLAVLRGNAEAGGQQDREQALDAVLNNVKVSLPSHALRNNILKITTPAAPAEMEAKVVPFHKPELTRHAIRPMLSWQTAALLAASLLIGVWIGAGEIGGTLVSESLDIASLQSGTDAYSFDIGLSEAEDLL